MIRTGTSSPVPAGECRLSNTTAGDRIATVPMGRLQRWLVPLGYAVDQRVFPRAACRYQVCLFCYQRLQNEYNNTCPGCRQQYSDDLDAVRQKVKRKQQQQQPEAATRPAASSNSHAGHGHGHAAAHGHGHSGHGHAAPHGHGHAAHHAQHHGSHAHGHVGSHRAAVKPGIAASGAAAVVKQRHANHDAAVGAHGQGHEAAGSSLPATANWVAAAAAPSSSVDSSTDLLPPTTVDDTAWPSLGDAVATSSNLQQQQPQHKENGLVRRRSSSSSLSSMHSQQQLQQHQQAASSEPRSRHDPARSSCDSSISTLTGHNIEGQQAEAQQPEQEQQSQLDSRSSSGFTSVEVTTVVSGTRHSVCVPVSNHSEVSPFPEAATLLEMLQAAVKGSKLSSTEAAVQLVQCLRKLEADSQHKQQNAWLQQVLANGRNGTIGKLNGTAKHAGVNGIAAAAGGRPPTAPPAAGSVAARAPPPGFGGHHAKPAASMYAPHLQQELAAAPYRPASAVQQQLLPQTPSDNYASQSSMHSVDSNSSLFSQGSSGLWTDSGLPGADFGAGVGGLGGGIPAAVPARLQMLWAGASGTGQGQSMGAAAGNVAASAAGGGYAASINPPPGFGNTLRLGAGTSRLANGGTSRLLNGSYNPLSYADGLSQAGTAAPPGFTVEPVLKQQQQQSIYRPWA